jgi:diguanylate cyclase
MIDVDFFKRVNDDYGHLVGDAVLREIAQTIRARVRRDDAVARYGGEEFVVVMPETPLSGALAAADEIRAEIAALVVEWRGACVSVTASIGCAELGPYETSEDLVRHADERCFAAKRAGRDAVF